nr:helicase HerA-like domain-containing protein [Brevibacterium sp. S22]
MGLSMLNRHDLVAGDTGTGKTAPLQMLAERPSRDGAPVFVSDVKGDLSGIGGARTDLPEVRLWPRRAAHADRGT